MLKNLRSAWQVFRRGYPPLVENFMVGHPVPIPSNLEDLTDAYRLIPAALAGIRAIASNGSPMPIIVYRRRRGSDEPLPDHPLAQLLNPMSGKFNPWTPAYVGWYAMFGYMNLVGNTFIAKDALLRGAPTELHILRPDWVQPIPGRDRPIAGYKYGPPGLSKQELDFDEVIRLPQFNPTSAVWGQSPIEAARRQMVLQLAMVAWNEEFFRNGATLGGVVAFKQQMSPDGVKRQREIFNEEHRGPGKAHKWRFVTGNPDVKELGQGMKDLQFNEGLTQSERAVLKCLGVPPSLVGYSEDQSYATALEQRRGFFQGKIMPDCTLRDSYFNLGLVPAFGKAMREDLYVRTDFSQIDELLPPLADVTNAAGSAFKNDAITFGEYRQWLKTRSMPDLKPTERDDKFRSEIILDTFGTGLEGDDPPAPKDGEKPEPAAADADSIESLIRSVWKDVDARRQAEVREAATKKAKVIQIRLDKHSPRYEKAVLQMFRDQEAGLLGAVDQLSLSDLGPVDRLLANQRDAHTAKVTDALGKIVKSVGQEEIEEFSSKAIFNAVSELAVEFVKKRGAQKVVLLDHTTADAVRTGIRDALLDAQIAGDNIVDTATRIMEAGIKAGFEIRRERANAIAQTETNAALSFADVEAWRQSDVVETKIWNTQGDDGVRDTHAELEGEEIAIDDPFDVGGHAMMHPGDPAGPVEEVVNCRCFLTPGKLKLSSRIAATRSRIAALLPNPPETALMNGSGVAHAE